MKKSRFYDLYRDRFDVYTKDSLSRPEKYQLRELLVENSQLGDPKKPSAYFARSLYRTLMEKFKKAGFINQGNDIVLKYFCALSSHLDYIDGIDAYFKLYDQTGRQISRATLDVSMNSYKDSKADVLIFFPVS